MASLGERILWTVYVVNPNKTTFERVEDVPHFTNQMVPIFLCLFLLEYLFLYLKKGQIIRVNDGFASIAHGMIMEITKLFTKGFEVLGYAWLYQYRFLDLDWQSPWTWWGTAIGVDLGYYWVHRAAHEISLFWCGHQVHHSSEEYNLSTALRQSAFQHLFSIGFYHPLALLGVPLPALLVHMQLNLFYQFWIHTECIPSLGPLEWVFNTASHHRVHHGINKWCLDKNYGGYLIIWDRIFGTFEAERTDETIVYGLVRQPQRLDPIFLQIFYFKYVVSKAISMENWTNTLKALFYGPGWQPGTRRLGDGTIPKKALQRKKFDPRIPAWVQVYLLAHFLIVIYVQQLITTYYWTFNWLTALCFILFVFFSLFTIGSAFENQWWAPFLESLRCVVTIIVLQQNAVTQYGLLHSFATVYFGFSAVIWTFHSLAIWKTSKNKIS